MTDAEAIDCKDYIRQSLDAISPEGLRVLKEFAAFLRNRPESRPPLVQLEGLWTGTPEITAEDIAAARHELWGRSAEEGTCPTG